MQLAWLTDIHLNFCPDRVQVVVQFQPLSERNGGKFEKLADVGGSNEGNVPMGQIEREPRGDYNLME